jgi:penicillin-binding protein 1A
MAPAAAAQLPVASFGKTGTTQENRDAYFIGFAGDLVTGVWIGRDDNQPVGDIPGRRRSCTDLEEFHEPGGADKWPACRGRAAGGVDRTRRDPVAGSLRHRFAAGLLCRRL